MRIVLGNVSGAALFRSSIAERRPEHNRYMQRTNAWFPGRLRKCGKAPNSSGVH